MTAQEQQERAVPSESLARKSGVALKEQIGRHFHPHFAAQLARVDGALCGVGCSQAVTGPAQVFDTTHVPQVDLRK